jgi:hypothetical protein
MRELAAAAIGVPVTFVLGWWGRGKWERYPWNAKPRRWDLDAPVNENELAGWEAEMRD